MSLVHVPIGKDEEGKMQYAKDEDGELILRNPTDFNLDTKFDATAQEFAGKALLERRMGAATITAEKEGLSLDKAQALELAKEWASLPDPRTDKSYYDGDGVNSSHHKTEDVLKTLNVLEAS